MAISLNTLRKEREDSPPRLLIYGPPGIGKTTLAAEFPAPVFLQVEDGFPRDLPEQPPRWGRAQLQNFEGVMDALEALYTEEHDRQTLVIDSLDKLEPWVWARTCELNGWDSIEAPGYGKGYLQNDYQWQELIDATNALRVHKGMTVLFLAHSAISSVNDPTTAEYTRFDIRIHKRAVAQFQDEMDAIFFINQDVTIKTDDRTKRKRADGGGNRWLYAQPRPAFVAKNRFGMPPKLMLPHGQGYATISPFFNQAGSGEETDMADAAE